MNPSNVPANDLAALAARVAMLESQVAELKAKNVEQNRRIDQAGEFFVELAADR